jgi:hypothetical protein
MISQYCLKIRYFGTSIVPTTSGWHGLKSEFQKLGIKVHTGEDSQEPSHLIEIDYVPSKQGGPIKRIPKSNRFLIATEPVTVNPIQFSKAVCEKFERVIVPSPSAPKNKNTVVGEGGYFNPSRYAQFFPNDGNRKGCALINENKFSFVRESNYALRSRFILGALNANLGLSIAGRNWTRGVLWTAAKLSHHFLIAISAGRLYFSLRDVIFLINFSIQRRRVAGISMGLVPDNVRYLSKFKVAIVIENESSYVSEKLHAALVAGCQCVYVGPPLDVRQFPSGFLFQSSADMLEIIRHTEVALGTEYSISEKDLEEYLRTSTFVREKGVVLRNSWVAKQVTGWISRPPSNE